MSDNIRREWYQQLYSINGKPEIKTGTEFQFEGTTYIVLGLSNSPNYYEARAKHETKATTTVRADFLLRLIGKVETN